MRAAVAALLMASTFASSQTLSVSPSDHEVFDAASIKPNKSGDTASTIGFSESGRFLAVNEPLARLIGEAYRTSFSLPRSQIIGGPNWIDSDRFDVGAVAEGNPSPEQRQAMLQALLADRFKMAVHRETKELPIYNLVKSSRDGQLGERLRVSDIDCAVLQRSGGQPTPAPPGQPRPCVMAFGGASLSAKGMTISQLATAGLARIVNRPVMDRTGLGAGAYDWTLDWAAEQPAQSSLGTTTQSDPDLPSSIFTAIQEQLGLRLESTKGPVDVLIIDHVEHPAEN